VTEPALAELNLRRSVEVEAIDDERRHEAANHLLLADLAERTGGRMLQADEMDQLAQLIPNRTVHATADVTQALWSTPLAFALILLLLTGEWIGRKMMRYA
jgi:hypothetical protein